MAMRIYSAPSGLCFQYPEGQQPAGYVLVKPAPKKRATANKAKQADNK
jgi:hypothetical protein